MIGGWRIAGPQLGDSNGSLTHPVESRCCAFRSIFSVRFGRELFVLKEIVTVKKYRIQADVESLECSISRPSLEGPSIQILVL